MGYSGPISEPTNERLLAEKRTSVKFQIGIPYFSVYSYVKSEIPLHNYFQLKFKFKIFKCSYCTRVYPTSTW